jgi:hypothetical protein
MITLDGEPKVKAENFLHPFGEWGRRLAHYRDMDR